MLTLVGPRLNARTFDDSLAVRINRIASSIDAHVGVALRHLTTGDTLSFNGGDHFPMQSVYKFPLALAVLDAVDHGRFTLDQKIRVQRRELLPGTWSPMRDDHPRGTLVIALRDLLRYTVAQSDNNGCDILFRLLKGPRMVEAHMRALGVADIAIISTEAEMHRDGSRQYRNWSTPRAMVELLARLSDGRALTPPSTALLLEMMTSTATGPMRLKGLLPEGTPVAHKTGSSGTDASGFTAATNDVGIITLPDGTHIAIAVFVSNSRADNTANERVIADIARAVWEQRQPE